MEDLYLMWDAIVQNELEGKLFFNIKSKKFDKKYFIFCYFGYPTYMKLPSYNGETYKDVVIYLKKKNNIQKDLIEIATYSFRIPLDSYLYSYLENNYRQIINSKILAEERKEKIVKILHK